MNISTTVTLYHSDLEKIISEYLQTQGLKLTSIPDLSTVECKAEIDVTLLNSRPTSEVSPPLFTPQPVASSDTLDKEETTRERVAQALNTRDLNLFSEIRTWILLQPDQEIKSLSKVFIETANLGSQMDIPEWPKFKIIIQQLEKLV